MGLNLFGGGGSSTSSSTTNNNYDNSTSYGLANTSGITVAGSNNTMTDLGAIESAFNFAGAMGDKSFGFADSAITSMEKMAGNAITASRADSSAFMMKSLTTVQNVSIAAGVLLVGYFVLKGKK